MSEKEKKDIIPDKFIDIDNVFKSKNPALFHLLPRFFLNYLKRVTHEEELNAVIYRNRDKFGLDFVEAMLNEFQANINVTGLDNIKPDERYIIASIHPLGGLDGLALMHVIGEVRRDIVFPVNDLLMNLPNLKELFIPINKHGSNAENIEIINRTFESDKMMLYFPAGLVSLKQKGVIRDVPWKKTFLTKARRYKRDIIPVHINGRNSNFFYNLANWRKRLRIKANIEMLYLVDEIYQQYKKDVRIIISKPVDISFFDKRQKDAEWAEILKEYVYCLPKGEKRSFDLWYNSNYKN